MMENDVWNGVQIDKRKKCRSNLFAKRFLTLKINTSFMAFVSYFSTFLNGGSRIAQMNSPQKNEQIRTNQIRSVPGEVGAGGFLLTRHDLGRILTEAGVVTGPSKHRKIR